MSIFPLPHLSCCKWSIKEEEGLHLEKDILLRDDDDVAGREGRLMPLIHFMRKRTWKWPSSLLASLVSTCSQFLLFYLSLGTSFDFLLFPFCLCLSHDECVTACSSLTDFLFHVNEINFSSLFSSSFVLTKDANVRIEIQREWRKTDKSFHEGDNESLDCVLLCLCLWREYNAEIY